MMTQREALLKSHPYTNHFTKKKTGKRYWFFRRFGVRTALPGRPGELEFERAYADALRASASLSAIPALCRVAGPKSMAALCASYRASPAYLGCKASTRRAYDLDLGYVEEHWGRYFAPGLTRAKVNELMANRAHEPKRANRLHKRLRALFEHAIDIGWIDRSPVGRRRPYKVKIDGFPCWPAEEIERFHARWPRGTKQRVAFDLLLYVGQRSVDTVAMARNHIAGGRIRVYQEKTGAYGWIRLHSELQATLEAGPLGGMILIETRAGVPRTVKGFYNWMKTAAKAAGCNARLSSHGLRKAAATRLIDAGCSAAEAAAITLHKSLAELERYVKERNQVRLADAAILKLEQNKNGN